MSGGKETPRQKMIGLMYLVLMALLAMNVSKSILDSFVRVNASLRTTKKNTIVKNQFLYANMDKKAAEDKAAIKYNDKAKAVHKEVYAMLDYIEGIKAMVIAETNTSIENVIGKDQFGNDTVIDLSHVHVLDNYDVPCSKMGLGSPEAPLDGPNTSKELEGKLAEFRTTMEGLLKGELEIPKLKETREELIQTYQFGEMKVHGHLMSWGAANFYHAPLAAVVTILSKVQADIVNTESAMLNYFFSQVGVSDFKFNTITPVVIADSYVLKGDSFRAQVYIAAYDSTATPRIVTGANYDSIKEELVGETKQITVEKGKGMVSMNTGSPGDYVHHGVVYMKNGLGTEVPYHFKTPYKVVMPSATVSPTKMNVFYKGVDNPIEVSAAGVSQDKIKPVGKNCKIVKTKKGYIVRVKKGNKCSISVMAKMPDGTNQKMGMKEFRVKNIPDPIASVAGYTKDNNKAKKIRIANSQGMSAMMKDFEFDLKYKIVGFDVAAIVGGKPVTAPSKSAYYTGDQKIILKKLKPGQKVYFENIKAKGPDGTVRNLGSLSFKLQ